MVTDTSGWGSKLFPEIRICFAAKAPVVLPRWMATAALLIVLAGAAGLSYLGVCRIGDRRLLAGKQAAIARAETANAGLKRNILGLENKLAALGRQRDRAEGRVAALASAAGPLRSRLDATEAKLQSAEQTQSRLAQQRQASQAEDGRVAELARTLAQTRQALHQAQAESTTLTAALSRTEADRADEAVQFARYRAELEATAKQLRRVSAVRGTTVRVRARVRAQLSVIERELAQLPVPPIAPAPLAASTAVQPAAPGTTAAGVADFGHAEVARLERALGSAGVDVARLFAQFGHNQAEGGPFVPPPKANAPINAVDPEKLAAIRGLAKVLPIAAPLAHYRIGSPFGPRIDPFNRQAAFHTGIDMDAPYMSPVYATAPGVVVHAGWLGDYGKVVEINHGFGIETLYAHLHRCLVSVGQTVAAHTEIGLVGTTGRSTGPHVHYEVRVDGQPQDPEKFMALSRLIPVAAGPLIPAAAARSGNSR